MSATATASLPQERRRALFHYLVEAQDRGMSVLQSRLQVAAEFGVRLRTVEKVEEEGIEKQWPPLSEPIATATSPSPSPCSDELTPAAASDMGIVPVSTPGEAA